MRYLTLITFLIIYTLVSPTRAEYQSGYNPKEEYNCRYSWDNEKVFHKNNDGETVPLDHFKDISDEFKETKKLYSNANFNFKFAVNGDLIRTSKIEGKNPTVAFHEVIQNNEHVIVANHNKKGHPNIILNTVIFKNDDVINSVESIYVSGPEKGEMTHYSLSWNGRCKRVEN